MRFYPPILLLLALLCPAVGAAQSDGLPKAAKLGDAEVWEKIHGIWTSTEEGRGVIGKNGLLVARKPAPAETTFTVYLRYDQLLYMVRMPASGVVFNFQDARNYDAIVTVADEACLAWKQIRDGKESIAFQSREGLLTEVGKPFALRLTLTKERVTAALSVDGTEWQTRIDQPRQEKRTGRLGLIAGATPTAFSWGGSLPTVVGQESSGREPVPRPNPLLLKDRPPTRAEYLSALKTLFEYFQENDKQEDVAAMAYAAMLAWRISGDEYWQAIAANFARSFVARYRTSGEVPLGFHVFHPTLSVLLEADNRGWLTTEEKAGLPDLAATALMRAPYERGAINRSLGNLAGTTPALKLAPDFPKKTEIEQVRKLVEGDFAKNSFRPLEDSTNYDMISLQYATIYALESRPDWWNEPGFRRAFEHLAATVSPSGHLPGFGDDDAGHPGVLLGLMEISAAKFNQPAFRDVARRVWNASFGEFFYPARIVGDDLLGLAVAATFAGELMTPAPFSAITILDRPDGSPSKAVLRNGDAWMLVDLVNGGEHGHNDALAMVSLWSSEREVLADNARYARGSAFHNRPLFTDHPADFPYPEDLSEQTRRMRQRSFLSGEWTFYRLPLRQHWIWGNFQGATGLPALARGQYHPDISIPYEKDQETAFLLEMRGFGNAVVELANPRLTGAGDTRDLPLEALTAKQNYGARIVADAFQGGPAAQWDVPLTPASSFLGGAVPGSFDVDGLDYDWLEFWLRVKEASDSRATLHSIVVGDRDGYPKRWLDINNAGGEVVVEKADSLGKAPRLLARQNFISPRGSRVPIIRDIFLAAPDFIWVRDTWRNEGSEAGFAGALWHGKGARLVNPKVATLASGLQISVSGAATSGISDRVSYGMMNQLAFFAGNPLASGQTSRLDSFLFPKGATSWREILHDGSAIVWTDGHILVGRNPEGGRIAMEGITTDAQLFIMNKTTNEGHWQQATLVIEDGRTVWQSESRRDGGRNP